MTESRDQGRLTRRAFALGGGAALVALTAAPASEYSALAAADVAPPPSPNTLAPYAEPLREAARRSGILFGAAYTAKGMTDRPLAELYAREAGLLVPDYELKWSTLRPSASTFDFSQADRLFGFAQANGMAFRGHCLCWEEFNPAWLIQDASPANAERLLTNHIQTVMGHYAGRVHSWDVVNEPIWYEHGMPNGLRNGVWLQCLGERYIDIAFRAARAADPKAMLVLNEAGTEAFNPSNSWRRLLFLRLIDRLQSRGVPLDAAGLECHLTAVSGIDRDDFGSYLNELSRRNLRIIISELDVSDVSLPATTLAERDTAVAAVYDAVAMTAMRNPSLNAVITWELSDRSSWMRDLRRDDGTPPRPLPYDALLRPKMARAALARAFSSR